jgi:hypothetical protein
MNIIKKEEKNTVYNDIIVQYLFENKLKDLNGVRNGKSDLNCRIILLKVLGV